VQLVTQQAQDTAYLAERNAAMAQLTDDEDIHEVRCGIDAVAAVPLGNYDPPLVPPLKLPGADPGQVENVARAEGVFQHSQAESRSKHFFTEMFDAILPGAAPRVNALSVGRSTLAITSWITGPSARQTVRKT